MKWQGINGWGRRTLIAGATIVAAGAFAFLLITFFSREPWPLRITGVQMGSPRSPRTLPDLTVSIESTRPPVSEHSPIDEYALFYFVDSTEPIGEAARKLLKMKDPPELPTSVFPKFNSHDGHRQFVLSECGSGKLEPVPSYGFHSMCVQGFVKYEASFLPMSRIVEIRFGGVRMTAPPSFQAQVWARHGGDWTPVSDIVQTEIDPMEIESSLLFEDTYIGQDGWILLGWLFVLAVLVLIYAVVLLRRSINPSNH